MNVKIIDILAINANKKCFIKFIQLNMNIFRLMSYSYGYKLTKDRNHPRRHAGPLSGCA
jgi:hypothetical protein